MIRIFRTAIFTLTAALTVTVSHAQFHTITPEKPMNKGLQQQEGQKKEDKFGQEQRTLFPKQNGTKIEVENDVPLFVNVRDSLLFGLLNKRLSVCLPLDFMHLTSAYGRRTDPFTKCERFHDGIDLRCDKAKVYAMLPGVVKEVRHGNKGYGNYVVLNHGNMECLYGHLSATTVREGDFLYAGTIVGISGNTGKSTAPHLHIALKKNGKSVDPDIFMGSLNGYIEDLKNELAMTKGEIQRKELNLETLAESLDKHGVHHSRIVIAQALLETGYFTSRLCLENNNLFGLRRPSDGSYYKFVHWEESVKAYRDYVQYKYKSGDYLTFLKDIGYASDRSYTRKVLQIAKALQFKSNAK